MFLHPSLRTAVTFVRYQSSDMLPSLSVFVKMVLKIGASCTAHSFRSLAGIVIGSRGLVRVDVPQEFLFAIFSNFFYFYLKHI